MEIKKIYERTFVFDEGHVRFFLLEGEEKALLIDSGMMTKNALDLAKECTDKPIELINTHADRDHIGSNNQFDWVYMHPAELLHYDGKIVPVWDGDILDLGNRKIQIIHMPGHTPGSIGILDIEQRTLFSGDPIQIDGKIFMFGSMRNIPMSIHTLERLEKMNSFDMLYPSHAMYPIDRNTITKIKKQSMEILEKGVPYTTMDMHGQQVRAYANGVSIILGNK